LSSFLYFIFIFYKRSGTTSIACFYFICMYCSL